MERRKEEKRRKLVYMGPCPLVTFAYHTNISQVYSLVKKISILGGYMRSGSLLFFWSSLSCHLHLHLHLHPPHPSLSSHGGLSPAWTKRKKSYLAPHSERWNDNTGQDFICRIHSQKFFWSWKSSMWTSE